MSREKKRSAYTEKLLANERGFFTYTGARNAYQQRRHSPKSFSFYFFSAMFFQDFRDAK